MGRYVIRRLLASLIFIFVVATAVFLIVRVLPGDPALLLLGESGTADQATLAALRSRLGLDVPLSQQYIDWITGIVKWDLGKSFFGANTVQGLLSYHFPKSLELIVISLVLSALIGVALGIQAALRRGSIIDVGINLLAAGGISIPVYVFGLLFVLVFAINLRWLPANGYVEFTRDPLRHITYLVLPVLTLSLTQWAQIVRITRSTVLEVQREDYVRTARAKGVPERRVIWLHVLRNALIPVITIISLQLGRSFGSMVLVESVFNWPGLSSLLISSVTRRDLPVVQGALFLIGLLVIVINFVTDLIYGVVDPRIRYE